MMNRCYCRTTTIAFFLCAGLAFGQTGTITTVSPNSAAQGSSGFTVTFTLGSSPPAPPLGAPLISATLGTLGGSSVTRVDTYNVTAVYTIPDSESTGAKDATVTFGGPLGDVVFSKTGGFTVTAPPPGPPTITQHPESRCVPGGGLVSFTVTASGSPPLSYKWQRNQVDLDGATLTSYTVDSASSNDAGNYRCTVTNSYGSTTSREAALTVLLGGTNTYPIVDTGQTLCYNATMVIAAPSPGAAFYGQDAQHAGHQSSFTLSGDGKTVRDSVTGLTWQRSPDTGGDGTITASDKLTWAQAQARPAVLNAASYGGYSDWRLPTIKELYSLIDFRGTDPSGMAGSDTSGLTPFIDTDYFQFAYGDTSAGERVIDSQYASANVYVGPNYSGEGGKLFGVNFADGRIKGYGLVLAGFDKTFFVQCVRGNTSYGINSFVDNGDQTVTDRATGLMWSKADSGTGMNWSDALAWVQTRNAANYLGHNDWRMPNAKELQSIVDYTRAPDMGNSASINPVFNCTPIANESGQIDYPWYWSNTTHAAYSGSGFSGCYVCFGRGTGYMDSEWVDVHGAGCQRSDPKGGSLTSYTYTPYGYYNSVAPQGDAIRIYNFVRLVRDATSAAVSDWKRY
jgi:hypothetical protein